MREYARIRRIVKKYKKILGLLFIAAVLAFFLWPKALKSPKADEAGVALLQQEIIIEPEVQPDRVQYLEIVDDSTYGILMAEAGISPNVYMELYDLAYDVYDLAKIRVGRTLNLVFDKDTDEFKQLVYQIDTEEELYVSRQGEGWKAERVPIDYEVKIKTASGKIETSMYQAALDAGIDIRAIIDLANVFQWSVDFSMDVQKGDEFIFIYEERYRGGEYVMPAQIFAGKFVNSDEAFYAFYFEESKENAGYFDEQGNSVQRMFLKAPVEYRYISSGYTTGKRYVEAFNVSTGHRAIDYAAKTGTPVRSVGDGKVAYAGWKKDYGNFISIRHNATYTTNYAHLSGFAVSSGEKVKQGDTIGYVGSTGFSTGPHLHYEMVKNGVKVNPLREVLPPGEPIKEENMERFLAVMEKYKKELD